jgi:Ca2+-binding EF-hand superfamily protein
MIRPEVSAVAAEKHGQTFAILDVDNDGYLRRDDFEALAVRLATGAADPDAQHIREVYLTFWSHLAMELDLPDHGTLARDDFINAMHSILRSTPDSFEQVIASMPRGILTLYDADGDGRLSASEFLRMQKALGTQPDRARIALLALDRDADGFINGGDLVHATREFVLSDDPHAPGNWLFGGLTPPKPPL